LRSSSSDEWPGFLRVGIIVGVHGIKGTLKVVRECETDAVFGSGGRLCRIAANGEKDYVKIRWFKPNGKVYLLSLEGIDDRNQAEPLVGSAFYVEKSSLPELDPDVYYWFELIGISVFDEKIGYIGKIIEIIETGANDVYVVRDGDREILIPAIEDVVKSVDVKKAEMRVVLPEGL
jgi:16S rRNA processing protein RimM